MHYILHFNQSLLNKTLKLFNFSFLGILLYEPGPTFIFSLNCKNLGYLSKVPI
jgi:hypothetical protein